MRKWIMALTVFVLCSVVSARAMSQPDSGSGLGYFYGGKNLQQINGGFSPYLGPGQGMGGELSFEFNTISKQSERAKNWQNYYGVSLDIRGVQGSVQELDRYGEREVDYYYAMVSIQSRLFYTDTGPVRPFVLASMGIGWGSVGLDDVEGEDDLIDNRYSVYRPGVQAGLQFMLNKEYGIVLGGSAAYEYSVIAGDSFDTYPATAFIGICKWMGPIGL